MYTLENEYCDCIRKENGKWGRFRTGEKDTFETFDLAFDAIKEMEEQGMNVNSIQIEPLI